MQPKHITAILLFMLSITAFTPAQMYDEQSNLTWEADLDIYGRVRTFVGRSLNSCPCRFQGQYFDCETWLCYNRFRYYDPNTGNYISQDPIRLNGGHTLYAYVSDPNSWLDIFGLAGNPETATHITYLGIDKATGKPYVGYASMQGQHTPEDVLKYRYGDVFSRFEWTPDVIYDGYGQIGKDTARGLEQRTFENLGKLDGTANKQNPVGEGNARCSEYLSAADEHLKGKLEC